MIRLLLLWLLTVAPLTAWAAAAENADERHLLFAMSQAMHQINYKGTFTYRRDDQMQGIEITHGVEGDREFERMVTLNGPTRKIVRDADQVRCELQQNDSFTVDQSSYPRPFMLSDSEQLSKLDQFYQISSEQSGSIAGFTTHKLSLMPKDEYRYGYRLWISSNEPHLLLRSEMVAGSGEILEQLLFTSLEILERSPESITTPQASAIPPGVDHSEKSEPMQWRISSLPPGYRKDVERFSMMEASPFHEQWVEHHLFSDGFSSVSLFIEPMIGGEKVFQPVSSQMGAVSLVSYLRDGNKITVVGEVPLATAELIAHSVERVE